MIRTGEWKKEWRVTISFTYESFGKTKREYVWGRDFASKKEAEKYINEHIEKLLKKSFEGRYHTRMVINGYEKPEDLTVEIKQVETLPFYI